MQRAECTRSFFTDIKGWIFDCHSICLTHIIQRYLIRFACTVKFNTQHITFFRQLLLCLINNATLLNQFSYKNIPFEIMNTMKRKINPKEIVCRDKFSPLFKYMIKHNKNNNRLIIPVHKTENSKLSVSAYLKSG